jgi:hypothetical protein
MVADGKDFSDDMDLDLDDIEVTPSETPTKAKRKPRNLKEQHREAKKVERGPIKNQSYSLPESLIAELREFVFTKKMAGEKFTASHVVEEGIRMYLKKHK